MNACTLISQCEESYTKMGIYLKEGEPHLRLHFNIFNIMNRRFNIKCYKQPQTEIETVFIKTNDNEDVYVDLTECSERLHISKKKILLAHKANALNDLISLSRFKELNQIIDHYKSAIYSYNEKNISTLISSGDDSFTIKKKNLMKIITLFHLKLHELKPPRLFDFEYTLKESIQSHSPPYTYKIKAAATTDHQFYILDMSSKKKYGPSGVYGIISKVRIIDKGFHAIIKESRIEDDPEDTIIAYECLQDEVYNLNLLSVLSITKGVQKPPFFNYKECNLSKKLYSVGYLYNLGDLFTCSQAIKNLRERVNLFADGFTCLISALYELHKNRIILHDIKPENILVEKDSDMKLHFCFGDVAGLRQIEEGNEEIETEVHTPSYSPKYPEDAKLSYQEALSFDVYQLGASIYTAITRTPPYLPHYNSKDYPDFNLKFNEEPLYFACSKEAIVLIKSMCDPDPIARIKIKQAFECCTSPNFSWA